MGNRPEPVTFVAQSATSNGTQAPEPYLLVGTLPAAALPAAGAARGGVLRGVAVVDQAALTAAASVGVPTKVEFDKVVADAVAARTSLNALLASLRTAGVIAP